MQHIVKQASLIGRSNIGLLAEGGHLVFYILYSTHLERQLVLMHLIIVRVLGKVRVGTEQICLLSILSL